MEVEKFLFALEETITYLRTSQASDPSQMSTGEIIRRLEAEAAKAKRSVPLDVNLLDRLFASTGPIQEISIHNAWGTKFLRIAEVVDEYTR